MSIAAILAPLIASALPTAGQESLALLTDTGFDNGSGQPLGIPVGDLGDGTVTALVSITNTSDERFGIGAAIFAFTAPDNLDYDFDFVCPFCNDGEFFWFIEVDNNYAQAVCGCDAGGSPAQLEPGQTIGIGTLSLSIPADTVPGTEFTFDFAYGGYGDGIFVEDVAFNPISVESGTTVTFVAVPEPASCLLVAIGLMLLKRRQASRTTGGLPASAS